MGAIGGLALLGFLIAAVAYLWWRSRDDDGGGGWDRIEPEPPLQRDVPDLEVPDEEPAWASAHANGESEAVPVGGGPSIAGVGEPAVPRTFSFRVPSVGAPVPFTEPSRPPA